jgi:hypothetical protein
VDTAIQYIYRDMALARDRTLSSAQKSRGAAEEELQETQALDDQEWTLIDSARTNPL